MDEIRPGRYRHYKGKEYEVLYTAKHSETLEPMVVYRALYKGGEIWARPASMWNEEVEYCGEKVRRFTYVGESTGERNEVPSAEASCPFMRESAKENPSEPAVSFPCMRESAKEKPAPASSSLNIRRAKEKDLEGVLGLLKEVLEIHAKIRPDIFIPGTTKYTREELLVLFEDEKRPVFVALGENGEVLGYAFCILKEQPFSTNMVPFTAMFIDDLCVDGAQRGRGIGRKLFEYVKEEAKRLGCYEVTLNVWEGNDSARRFYEGMGMTVKESQMELILK